MRNVAAVYGENGIIPWAVGNVDPYNLCIDNRPIVRRKWRYFDSLPIEGKANVAALCGGNGIAASGDRLLRFAPCRVCKQTSSSPLRTKKICFLKITSKSVGATCGRPSKTMKFYVIHGGYLAKKHLQTCRAVARLAPKTKEGFM